MSFLYRVPGFSLGDGVRNSVIYRELRVGPGEVMGCLIRMPPLERFEARQAKGKTAGGTMSPSSPGKASGSLRRTGQSGRLRGTSGFFCVLLPPDKRRKRNGCILDQDLELYHFQDLSGCFLNVAYLSRYG